MVDVSACKINTCLKCPGPHGLVHCWGRVKIIVFWFFACYFLVCCPDVPQPTFTTFSLAAWLVYFSWLSFLWESTSWPAHQGRILCIQAVRVQTHLLLEVIIVRSWQPFSWSPLFSDNIQTLVWVNARLGSFTLRHWDRNAYHDLMTAPVALAVYCVRFLLLRSSSPARRPLAAPSGMQIQSAGFRGEEVRKLSCRAEITHSVDYLGQCTWTLCCLKNCKEGLE